MQQLTIDQFSLAQPLFAELAACHFSVAAVLAGKAPGEVYVDRLESPRVGFATTPEGEYLAGDVTQQTCYPAFKALIPSRAYLTLHPPAWAAHLDEIWTNPAARPHARYNLRLETFQLTDWRTRIPEGFEIVPVDQAFLERRDLKHHGAILNKLAGWFSHNYFLQHGFGFCALEGDTIASGCVADCAVGEQCEMGIATHHSYRRRGLATLVVAAAVEHCLAQGMRQIGWHCLQSNTGSIGVATRVGFVKAHEYVAYSSVLPTENVEDMSRTEYLDWAAHYERFIPLDFRYGYDAARAWALAGDAPRALAHLRDTIQQGEYVQAEWLAHDWVVAGLRGHPDFEEMIARLQKDADNTEQSPS